MLERVYGCLAVGTNLPFSCVTDVSIDIPSPRTRAVNDVVYYCTVAP
jgi:hypothetical protein